MPKVRVNSFSISLDGFGAGPNQSLENPLGENGPELHGWVFPTQSFRKMHGGGGEGGTTGIDNDFSTRAMENVGAWILGRNMFGPVRGPWPDDSWKGWWGASPPYHCPVFVLTHHARPDLVMEGGTVFHFVTGGIGEALERAKAAAGEKDVRIGGGVSLVRQYLEHRAIDELHLAVSPVFLGRGENLFAGIDLRELGYRCTETVKGEAATHVKIVRA